MQKIISNCSCVDISSEGKGVIKNGKDIIFCDGIFPNEKADDQRIYSNKYYNRLKKLGFTKENIYVFDHKKPDNFKNLNIDLIYVGGGNTFATLQKLRDSGFDTELVSYIKSGVTYIGGSCGAHIVSRNIEHLLPFDDNYVNLTDFSGLCLVDGIKTQPKHNKIVLLTSFHI